MEMQQQQQQQQQRYQLLARSNDISGDGNFTQGCSFSPDGLCILTSTSYDCRIRLYNTPPVPAVATAVTPSISTENDDHGGGGKEKTTHALEDDMDDTVEEMQEAESSSTMMSTA
eukprot:12502456-Ditylum_brightwellii.AAC.1